MTIMPFHDYLRIVRGGFGTLACGDALGVPVETLSHEAILAATGGKGVTGYIPPAQTRVKDTAGLPPGSWSDDTQLTLVVNGSLVRSRGFDLEDQGLALAEAYESSAFGWGGTTTDAAKAFVRWRDTKGKEGRNPQHPAPRPEKDGASAGSGPAMKIFPLAAYCLIGRDGSPRAEMQFLDHAMDLGRQTHGDLRASIASVALGHAIAAFAHAPKDADDRFFRTVVAEEVLDRTERAESMYRYVQSPVPPFSSYLAKALSLLDDPVALRTEVNATFLAVHSVPFAIATALRHHGDLVAGVLEGVNAGKDTDTIGSMVGAMLGSRHGLDAVPAEWLSGLRAAKLVIDNADDLAMMVYDVQRGILPPWEKDRLH